MDMPKVIFLALLGAMACFAYTSGSAEEISQAEIRSLDEQVQEIKSDVLGIAAELSKWGSAQAFGTELFSTTNS